jgi:uncharacterized protein with PIN domain
MDELAPLAFKRLWRFLEENEIAIIPFDKELVLATATAYQRNGRGINSKHASISVRLCGLRAGQMHECSLVVQRDDFAEADLKRC